jgi:hypothetical protein
LHVVAPARASIMHLTVNITGNKMELVTNNFHPSAHHLLPYTPIPVASAQCIKNIFNI